MAFSRDRHTPKRTVFSDMSYVTHAMIQHHLGDHIVYNILTRREVYRTHALPH